MNKIKCLLIIISIISFNLVGISEARTITKNGNTYFFDEDLKEIVKNDWRLINLEGTELYFYYYFNEYGIMAKDTIINGLHVNKLGIYVENDKPQAYDKYGHLINFTKKENKSIVNTNIPKEETKKTPKKIVYPKEMSISEKYVLDNVIDYNGLKIQEKAELYPKGIWENPLCLDTNNQYFTFKNKGYKYLIFEVGHTFYIYNETTGNCKLNIYENNNLSYGIKSFNYYEPQKVLLELNEDTTEVKIELKLIGLLNRRVYIKNILLTNEYDPTIRFNKGE